MPLEPYARGATWWAKGRIEYNGRPITDYLRESTGSSDESGARDWINERTEREIRAHVVGEEHVFTFSDAVMIYKPNKDMAKYLLPLVRELGQMPVRKITPKMIREMGRTALSRQLDRHMAAMGRHAGQGRHQQREPASPRSCRADPHRRL
jgi:hypothetical protein